MRLSTARRWLMMLLLTLSVAALAFDLVLRSAIDLNAPRSVPPVFRMRRARDLTFLRQAATDVDPLSLLERRQQLDETLIQTEAAASLLGAALTLTDKPTGRPQDVRGLVLPLDESDAALGVSLLLNLRLLGRDAAAIPAEIAHCGDAVPRAFRLAFESFFPLGPVRFHDVCAAAASKSNATLSFCQEDDNDTTECRVQLQDDALRLAAVVFSEFDELLLLDAASLFFHDPTSLFDDAAYQCSGALFFPAARRHNGTSPSAGDSDQKAARFDSSLAVWNKRSQRQSTATLAVFLAEDITSDRRESSSELLAAACERSGADYAVARFDAGVVGSIVVGHRVNATRDAVAAAGVDDAIVSLCGALTQFAVVPAASSHRLRSSSSSAERPRRPRPLFLAGRSVLDEIVSLPRHLPSLLVYTTPVTSNGTHESLILELNAASSTGDECAAIASPAAASSGAAVGALSKHELGRVVLRRQQYQHVLDWARNVADWSVLEASLSRPDAPTSPQDDDRLEDLVRARVSALVASEEQLVYSLDQLAQRTSRERGIVLPLYDKIAVLGVSLVLELRELGVDLPVEVAHCGDLSPKFALSFAALLNDGNDAHGVRFYDVCALALQERSALFPSRPLFCRDLSECHRKFRGFDIKILALVLSEFAEVLLLDADTLFFSDPTALFDTQKYRETGTLFFHDRISGEVYFMAQRLARDARQTVFHDYMLAADVSRFAAVPTLARPMGELSPRESAVPPSPAVVLPNPMELPFAPSAFLLSSNTWNARAGFEMDSSCVLWNKHRQPRATAVLASFIGRNDVRAPPSYGDKELFFVACELAETRYAFSDFGIGAVGTHVLDYGPDRSVLCGDMSQNVPEWTPDGRSDNSPLLYINSDNILAFQPDQTTVYYSKPRPADVYPGPFPWQQECPFNVTAVAFSDAERARVYRRQRLHSGALDWLSTSAVW